MCLCFIPVSHWGTVSCVLYIYNSARIYYFSFHQRKPTGVQLNGPQFHNEEEDGAVEGGNGADRSLTAGQWPQPVYSRWESEQSLPGLHSCYCCPVLECDMFRKLFVLGHICDANLSLIIIPLEHVAFEQTCPSYYLTSSVLVIMLWYVF